MGESVGAIPLSVVDLAVAAALVLIAGIVSILLKLRLERQLALAATRTVVQLLLVGYILKWVFDIEDLLPILALAAIMAAAAGHAAVGRCSRTFPGAMYSAFATLAFSGLITTVIVTAVIINAEPWYKPQYLIPLLGMVLGNSLTGISLTMDTLLERLTQQRDEVEMLLALGATRWEAARDALAQAVRRGMIPIINTMMVVGIVALPGMMTGQILQGADPAEAVRYQIVVMFMVTTGTSMGCISIVLLMYRKLFTHRHQLDLSRVKKRGER